MAMARAVPAQLTWAGPVLHPLHGIAAPTQPEIISHRTRQGLQVYYKIFNILVCQCVWERSQEEEKNGGYWEGRSRRRGSYGYRWRFNLQIRPTHRFASRVSLHPAAKSWSLCKASKVFYPFSFKPIQPTFSNSFLIVLRPCVFFFCSSEFDAGVFESIRVLNWVFFSFYSFIWVRMAFNPSSKGCVFSWSDENPMLGFLNQYKFLIGFLYPLIRRLILMRNP